MPRLHFTTRSVDALKSEGSRVDYFDSSFRLRGASFGLRVSENGSKEYFVRYRDQHKKQRRMSIGDAQLTSLAKAREKAREIATALDHGKNPAEELRQYKLAESIEELCELYLANHAKFKKDGGAEDQRRLNKDVIPHIGRFKARDIRRQDILELIDKVAIERKAPVSANRLRALLTKLFNFALEREIIQTSPCAGLPRKPREKPKDRYLSEDEISKLWQWLEQQRCTSASVLKFILLTGQRPGEVSGMVWTELRGDTWELPGTRTKNGKPHIIPLSRRALETLEPLIATRKDLFVFPGERGPYVMARTIQHLAERAVRELKIHHFTPHDLRRTITTYLRKLQVPREIVARMLNHSNHDSTSVYDRYDLVVELRKALEDWAAEIGRMAKLQEPKVKVVCIGQN